MSITERAAKRIAVAVAMMFFVFSTLFPAPALAAISPTDVDTISKQASEQAAAAVEEKLESQFIPIIKEQLAGWLDQNTDLVAFAGLAALVVAGIIAFTLLMLLVQQFRLFKLNRSIAAMCKVQDEIINTQIEIAELLDFLDKRCYAIGNRQNKLIEVIAAKKNLSPVGSLERPKEGQPVRQSQTTQQAKQQAAKKKQAQGAKQKPPKKLAQAAQANKHDDAEAEAAKISAELAEAQAAIDAIERSPKSEQIEGLKEKVAEMQSLTIGKGRAAVHGAQLMEHPAPVDNLPSQYVRDMLDPNRNKSFFRRHDKVAKATKIPWWRKNKS